MNPTDGAVAVIKPLQLTIPPQGHRVESRGRLGGGLAAERQGRDGLCRLSADRWAKLGGLGGCGARRSGLCYHHVVE
jgi:hypothetical protein